MGIIRKRKRAVGTSWRMDETYIKVKGKWRYLYRAVDKAGKTIDFLVTKNRDKLAAKRFLIKAIEASVANKSVLEKGIIMRKGQLDYFWGFFDRIISSPWGLSATMAMPTSRSLLTKPVSSCVPAARKASHGMSQQPPPPGRNL